MVVRTCLHCQRKSSCRSDLPASVVRLTHVTVRKTKNIIALLYYSLECNKNEFNEGEAESGGLMHHEVQPIITTQQLLDSFGWPYHMYTSCINMIINMYTKCLQNMYIYIYMYVNL